MALFRRKKKSRPTPKINSATIITSCMEITGELKGSDTVHIDGTVIGNVSVSNILVIGKSGYIKGNVYAKHAIINGKLEGSIMCDTLEIMEEGQLSQEARAKEITIDGSVDGIITAVDKINLLEHAIVNTEQIRSKNITVDGKLTGEVVASKLLRIGTNGQVSGEINAKRVELAPGAKLDKA
ncbi:polymer-forming cytoskeletal protein [Sulfurovum sp. zt1-1]|uniref:Polymer-forming cytoskeletal protein n=1 Tax=Sulfurovum zhangzhouensis TaxID=3019067 RepID=A0ABT7QW16_9BACT|nr:polymer-forming cytoskeletal protein [Sulfurovum zhangzhouensis]MDM5271035.1 polymer-forming cytoskeletal protein [Sulfurovum zhangzhouensis]